MDTVRVDARDLARLHRMLQGIDSKASKQLTSRIRKIGTPMLEEVRRSALSLPSKPHAPNHHGLGMRAGIAKAAELRIGHPRSGAFSRIRISGSKFQRATGKYRKLPRYMEGLSRRPWRRPAHARKGDVKGAYKGRWVVQQPKPYLLKTVLPHKSEFSRAIAEEYLATFDRLFREAGING